MSQNRKNQYVRHGVVAMTFLLFVWVANFSAHSAPLYDLVLTDADKREIFSQILKRELGSIQNEQDVVILLSPRTNTDWLPEIPGVRFKQLAYGEESKVPEYYEIGTFQIHGNRVEVMVTKGNYCKKVGSIYQFHKEHGNWQGKTINATESFTVGGDCVGCKTGSGLVYKVKSDAVKSKDDDEPNALVLAGKVLGTRCKLNNTRYIACEIDLRLDFSNKSSTPIIILQPFGEYKFWHGGNSLSLNKTDANSYNYVYLSSAWPSIYKTSEYSQLAEQLDQKSPPPNLTRIINPNESWNWNTTILLGLEQENNCNGATGVEIGWRAIKELTSSLWLKISYEMWPFNVENFKKDLGGKLRERWKQYGNLYLEEKSDSYWFAHITSEPIELDLRQTQLQ